MRPRNVAAWLSVIAAIVVAACTSETTLAPPGSPEFARSQGAPVCDVSRVTALINGLFPPGPTRGQAHASFASVRSQLNSGLGANATASMFDLLKTTLARFELGSLNAPSRLGLSAAQGVGEFGSQLYACTGMAGQAPTNLGEALASGGTAEVVVPSNDPEPQVVETDDGRAAVSFPAGSITQPLLVTIEPDPDGTHPFPSSTLAQYPPFFDFSTFPHVDHFEKLVTVGICVSGEELSPATLARLQLAHPDPATNRTTLEILHRVAPPPGICGSVDGPIGMRAGSTRPVLAQRVLDFLLPQQLRAALLTFGGVGGQTGSFTDFRAVDPASALAFTVEPGETEADATITPPVQVAVQTSEGETISSFHGNVTLLLQPVDASSEATLAGTTTVAAVNGVATFSDLSVDLAGTYKLVATAVGTLDPVTGVADPTPRPDTTAVFAIAGGQDNPVQTLLRGLHYPKGLWVDGGTIYLTETAGRNTTFGGNVRLVRYDLELKVPQTLVDHPVNSDAVVLENEGPLYLTSYAGSIPGEAGKVSTVTFNGDTWVETPLMDLGIASNDMFIDAEQDIYILGSSDNQEAPSLYVLPSNNRVEGASVLESGLGRVSALTKVGSEIYYSTTTQVRRRNSDVNQLFVDNVFVTGLTSDGSNLYYADFGAGTVSRKNFETGQVQTVVAGLNHPLSIKYDANSNRLYLLEAGTDAGEYHDGTLKYITISD